MTDSLPRPLPHYPRSKIYPLFLAVRVKHGVISLSIMLYQIQFSVLAFVTRPSWRLLIQKDSFPHICGWTAHWQQLYLMKMPCRTYRDEPWWLSSDGNGTRRLRLSAMSWRMSSLSRCQWCYSSRLCDKRLSALLPVN